MVKRRQPHRHDKSFTMGAAGIGASGLLPSIFAVAVAVAMIIALGLELGVLYDYRVRDFKAVTDGSAFLNNGSQCLRHATTEDLQAYYGTANDPAHFDCAITDHRKNLGMLLTASVHQLYYKKDENNQLKNSYHAAVTNAGVYYGGNDASVSCEDAQTALRAIANGGAATKCTEIYTSPDQATCTSDADTAGTAAVAVDDGTPNTAQLAGIDAAKAAKGLALAKDKAGIDAAKEVVGSAAANAQVAADADPSGTVGDNDSGDAAIAALATPITNQVTANAASAAAGAAYATAVTNAAITDEASAAAASADAAAAYATAAAAITSTDLGSYQSTYDQGFISIDTVAQAKAYDTECGLAAANSALKCADPPYQTAFDVAKVGWIAAYVAARCPDTSEDLSGLTVEDNYAILIDDPGDDVAVKTLTGAAEDAATTSIVKWNLYLQCTLTAGLGNIPPVATADNLAPVPTASRGGTLDIPLYRRKSTSGSDCFGYLQPAYTPPPMLYGDFNCSVPRQARAKVMYGARLGWSLFATVPCVILIVYLGADAALAALCFFFRASSERATARKDGKNSQTDLPVGVVTQLATISEMRYIRLGLSLVGFLLVVILKAVYDWAPWVTGTVLPQATTCGENGWQTEQDATVMHFIVIILILASIIVMPLSQLGVFKDILGGGARTASSSIDTEAIYQVAPGTTRLYYWFLLTLLGFIALIAFEAADGVAWGISWAGRQLDVYAADLNSLDVDKAATLVEEAATSAVLCAVSTGVLLSLAYARWLFTSYGKQNCLCSIIWLGCVIAGLIPIFITWGFKLVLDPNEQEVLDKCDYLTPDSFEATLCTNRAVVFTIALLLICAVFAIMFCCWQIKVLPTLFKRNNAETPSAAADSGSALRRAFDRARPAKEAMGKEKIPLLSLRVRH